MVNLPLVNLTSPCCFWTLCGLNIATHVDEVVILFPGHVIITSSKFLKGGQIKRNSCKETEAHLKAATFPYNNKAESTLKL